MLAFQELVIGAEELGAHPAAMSSLLGVMEDPLVSADELVPFVEQDAGLTTNILKLCNSSSYGCPREIGSVREALVLMGNISFAKMAFVVCVEQVMLRRLPVYRLEPDEIWRHSLCVGFGAGFMARQMGWPELKDRAFTVGVLHDSGKLLLDPHLNGLVDADDRDANGSVPVELERMLTGFDHAEAGAAILSYWDFPQTLVQAVRGHHEPEHEGEHADLSRCIFAADTVSHLVDRRVPFDPQDETSPYRPVLESGFSEGAISGLSEMLLENSADTMRMALKP